jgi:cytochrome c peroxidase
MHGSNANAIYCHAHNALAGPSGTKPSRKIDIPSKLDEYALRTRKGWDGKPACLSCHDGSVGVGRTVSIGTLQMTGALRANLGVQLQGSHPFSMQPQIKDNATLVSTLVASHATKDSAVSLVDDNIECSTCHDVHNQYKDPYSQIPGTRQHGSRCALRATM